MKLSRDQRKALFDGIPVKITFPGAEPCPIEVGHIEVLSVHVRLEVTDIRRTKGGDHVLVYTLFNDRLGQRFMAKQQGQLPTPNGSDDGQYVHNGGSGFDYEAGEAVDDFTQRRITREARDREKMAIEELFVVLEDLRSAVRDRLEMNPDAVRIMGRDAWALRSKIDSVERRLKRRRVA